MAYVHWEMTMSQSRIELAREDGTGGTSVARTTRELQNVLTSLSASDLPCSLRVVGTIMISRIIHIISSTSSFIAAYHEL